MKDITSLDQFQTQIDSETLTIVDFWAPWCGPCKNLMPILEQASTELGPEAELVKVNIEDFPQISATYSIRTIPTIMVFKAGELMEATSSCRTAEAVHALVKSHQG